MKIWNTLPVAEILQSLEMELAKSRAELKCAHSDVEKAQNRVAFCLTAIHELKNRDLQD